MLGGTLIRGPSNVPKEKVISIEVSRPCELYLLLNTEKDNSGWPDLLKKEGWIRRSENVRWHEYMTVYFKAARGTTKLPPTTEDSTVMAIVYKEPLLSGNFEIIL